MKLKYTVSRGHYFSFQLRSLVTNTHTQILYLALFMFVGISSYLNEGDNPEVSTIARVLGSLLAFLIIVIPLLFIFTASLSYLRKGKGIFGDHTLEINEDTVIETSETTTTSINKDKILKIWRGSKIDAIYTTANSAILVPRVVSQAEDNREQYESFIKEIKK